MTPHRSGDRENLPASYPAGSRSTLSSPTRGATPFAPRVSFAPSGATLSGRCPPGGGPRVCHNGPVANQDEIRSALQGVIDPELHRSIVELDMVRSIDVGANGVVDVTVSLTTPGCPIKGHFQTGVADAVSALDGVTHVNVYFDVLSDGRRRRCSRSSAAEACLTGRWRRCQTCCASARARAAWASPR